MATVKKGSKAAKAKMAKVRAARAKKAPKKAAKKTAYKEVKQIPVEWTNSGGYLYRYNKEKDMRIKKALPPGVRVSKEGNIYYERRVNRSDAKGSLTGLGAAINADKNNLMNKLYNVYGNWQSALIQAKTKADKNVIKKRIAEIKKQINKLK